MVGSDYPPKNENLPISIKLNKKIKNIFFFIVIDKLINAKYRATSLLQV